VLSVKPASSSAKPTSCSVKRRSIRYTDHERGVEEEIMRRADPSIPVLTTILTVAMIVLCVPPANGTLTQHSQNQAQQEEPGRGDDLARIRRWRSFLDRADRAFTAAHMSTTAVKAKTKEADERIAELEEAENNPDSVKYGRSDITGDVSFLERAQRAFTAAHLSTTEVNQWLAEAKEAADGE
jgi:hypothetical protein